jgi:hypothetical protein
MGRIHRYGQLFDCLIFNFVATNTIEGRVLQRLLEKLQEIPGDYGLVYSMAFYKYGDKLVLAAGGCTTPSGHASTMRA